MFQTVRRLLFMSVLLNVLMNLLFFAVEAGVYVESQQVVGHSPTCSEFAVQWSRGDADRPSVLSSFKATFCVLDSGDGPWVSSRDFDASTEKTSLVRLYCLLGTKRLARLPFLRGPPTLFFVDQQS